MERFIGLMSGTSADGVDAVIASFDAGRLLKAECSHHLSHPHALRAALIGLGRDQDAQLPLETLARLEVAVAEQFAAAALGVLDVAGLRAQDICAIGSHGQTIFHDPKHSRSSLQIGDPNLIAALTGIPVAADFRRMDIALGGQGAPLVPAFHEAVFATATPSAIVNIGGIANVTLLSGAAGGDTTGYDCGPGNALMDEWVLLHRGIHYDAGGEFAATGIVLVALLDAWLNAPYFRQPPPKSTGRSLFNLDWARALAPGGLEQHAPADVQATLCELTARSIRDAIPAATRRVLVCGGGAFNSHLMQRLAALLPSATIDSTEVAGLPPQWVEATAFAWLAHQRVHKLPGNLPSVTGASRAAILGGLYGGC
ncbi:MAG: anhydro-N-acetylmuramic acid kinase [Pseudomonadota bacterium]